VSATLPRPPAGTPIDTNTRYLLRAALAATHRVNGAGLLIRASCFAVLLVCSLLATDHNAFRSLLLLPLAIGLGLAAIEWLATPLDRMAAGSRPLPSRIGRWLASTRERAVASVAGVLEVLVGPLLAGLIFAGPSPAPMGQTMRLVALVALVIFVGNTVVQVTNDPGYYNRLDNMTPKPWLVAFRLALPVLAALVVFALLTTTAPQTLPRSQSLALASLLLFAYVPMGLSDAIQRSALEAHSTSLSDTVVVLRSWLSSDTHRLGSAIKARAVHPGTTVDARRALEDIYFEVEAIRRLTVEERTTLTLGDTLHVCRLILHARGQDATLTFDVAEGLNDTLLDPSGVGILEHLVLDLVDNAAKSQVPQPDVRIRIEATTSGAATRTFEVWISDDGPGFDAAAPPLAGSSTRQLMKQCRGHGGDLTITSTPAGTLAHATFMCENLRPDSATKEDDDQ